MDGFSWGWKGIFPSRNLADSVSGSRSGCKSHQPRPLQLLLLWCQLPPRFLGQFQLKICPLAKKILPMQIEYGCRKGNKVEVHKILTKETKSSEKISFLSQQYFGSLYSRNLSAYLSRRSYFYWPFLRYVAEILASWQHDILHSVCISPLTSSANQI